MTTSVTDNDLFWVRHTVWVPTEPGIACTTATHAGCDAQHLCTCHKRRYKNRSAKEGSHITSDCQGALPTRCIAYQGALLIALDN